MRRVVVALLLLLANIAHADGAHSTLYGLGSAIGKHHQPGWNLRIEKRLDATRTDEDDEEFIAQGRIGIDAWSAGPHWGFSMPVGMQMGGQWKHVRTSLGGGLGLWAFAKDHDEHYGIAPFANTSLEVTMGKMIVSLDARVSRQVVSDTTDFNVYSVMVMVGRRYAR